ncbi:hypothetical protein [Vallitalea okinawensis]|uniref:hypothetical protein n=1 Tax=Vallitalea okinawensis TaxID=2078660 RepID=UPI000CFCB082|nr:hypothetical protein [Vallitalea okinawensis]
MVHQSLLLKIALYKEYPYLSQFIIKANEELNPEIAEAIYNINQRKKNNYLGQIFENVDYSKFKEGTDIDDLFKMIEWCGDGIWNEGINSNHSVDRMYQQAIKMIDFFKQAVYKQEYFER